MMEQQLSEPALSCLFGVAFMHKRVPRWWMNSTTRFRLVKVVERLCEEIYDSRALYGSSRREFSPSRLCRSGRQYGHRYEQLVESRRTVSRRIQVQRRSYGFVMNIDPPEPSRHERLPSETSGQPCWTISICELRQRSAQLPPIIGYQQPRVVAKFTWLLCSWSALNRQNRERTNT